MYFIKCRNGSKGIYIKMDFIFDGEFWILIWNIIEGWKEVKKLITVMYMYVYNRFIWIILNFYFIDWKLLYGVEIDESNA